MSRPVWWCVAVPDGVEIRVELDSGEGTRVRAYLVCHSDVRRHTATQICAGVIPYLARRITPCKHVWANSPGGLPGQKFCRLGCGVTKL